MNRPLLALTGLAAWGGARALRARRAVSFAGRVAVVSGGSRGLGLMIARRLAAEGARPALLARTATDLDAARADVRARTGVEPLAIPCDVSDRAQVESAVRRVAAELGPPSVLVHDAGIIEVGPEAHMDERDYRETMGVHFWGAYYLTEALKPHLVRDGAARVAYVSSIAGRVAVPHLVPYVASKHALKGYADGVRAELAGQGVAVTTVTPGLMRTGSHPNAIVKGDHQAEFAPFAIADAAPLVSMDGDRAADKIVDALRHGDPALTLTFVAKALAAVDGVAPGLTGRVQALVDRLLPDPVGPEGDRRQTGWESFSETAPSALTALADDDVVPNNELRGHSPDRL